jgi:hypothetical protein
MISDVDSLAHTLTVADPGQIYKQASQKLQEHRAFFSEMGRVEAELASMKAKPEESGTSSDQIADLHRRLMALPGTANRREIRLYYIERKVRGRKTRSIRVEIRKMRKMNEKNELFCFSELSAVVFDDDRDKVEGVDHVLRKGV